MLSGDLAKLLLVAAAFINPATYLVAGLINAVSGCEK